MRIKLLIMSFLLVAPILLWVTSSSYMPCSVLDHQEEPDWLSPQPFKNKQDKERFEKVINDYLNGLEDYVIQLEDEIQSIHSNHPKKSTK